MFRWRTGSRYSVIETETATLRVVIGKMKNAAGDSESEVGPQGTFFYDDRYSQVRFPLPALLFHLSVLRGLLAAAFFCYFEQAHVHPPRDNVKVSGVSESVFRALPFVSESV